MNQKQKINLASLIVSRCNIHLLRRIFLEELPDGEQAFMDFWAAEQEGHGERYLREHAVYFPPERRNVLADYYKIRGILEMMMVHRGEKIFSAIPSRIPECLEVQNQGVLAEYEFLKSVFEKSGEVHRNTILTAIAEEIDLYQQYADLIIGLHPNWRNDETFADFSEADNTAPAPPHDLEDMDETDLAFYVLRQIAPDEQGNWLPFTSQEHSRWMEAVRKEVSFLLRLDDGLSEVEKRQLTTNNQALLQYLASVDEPANVAYIALIYQTISPENRRTPEFTHGIWKLGVQYARLEGLAPEDHEAIRRLFLYFTRVWEKHRDRFIQLMGTSAKPMIVKAWIELAKSNAALAEWQATIDCYMKVAALRHESGEFAKAGKALFDAVDSLQTAGLKKEALALAAQLLQPAGNMPAELGLPAGFELDAEAREAIEVNLVNLMDEVDLLDRTIRDYASLLQTDAARALYRLHMGLEQDAVFFDDMQQAQQVLTDFYRRQHAGNAADPYNRAVDFLLHQLNDYRDAYAFEARLQEIQAFEDELPIELKLLYQLNLAKLAYLRDDPACLDAFSGLLSQMDKYPDPFDEPRQSQWLTSAIRAWHLSLPDRLNRLEELEGLAVRALNVLLKGYLARFRDRSALDALMNESEELIKALLLNEVFVQKDLAASQRLLRMVWNVLMFRKEFLNRYLSKSGLEIIQESRYLEQVAAFRQELFAYIANPTHQRKPPTNPIFPAPEILPTFARTKIARHETKKTRPWLPYRFGDVCPHPRLGGKRTKSKGLYCGTRPVQISIRVLASPV